eukprot:6191533-Pleurochrysis_carterae.AAC.5
MRLWHAGTRCAVRTDIADRCERTKLVLAMDYSRFHMLGILDRHREGHSTRSKLLQARAAAVTQRACPLARALGSLAFASQNTYDCQCRVDVKNNANIFNAPLSSQSRRRIASVDEPRTLILHAGWRDGAPASSPCAPPRAVELHPEHCRAAQVLTWFPVATAVEEHRVCVGV